MKMCPIPVSEIEPLECKPQNCW